MCSAALAGRGPGPGDHRGSGGNDPRQLPGRGARSESRDHQPGHRRQPLRHHRRRGQLRLHLPAAGNLHAGRGAVRLPQGRAHGRGTAGQPARAGGPRARGRRRRRDHHHRRDGTAAREPIVRARQRHPGEAGPGPAPQRAQLRAAGHAGPRRLRRGVGHARHDHERDAARRPAPRDRAVRERQPRELEQLPHRRDRQQHAADPRDRDAPERGGDPGVQGPDQPLLRGPGAQPRRAGQRGHQVRRQLRARRRSTGSCATTPSTPTTSSRTAPDSPSRRSSSISSAAPSAGRSSRTGPSSSPTTTGSARTSAACS